MVASQLEVLVSTKLLQTFVLGVAFGVVGCSGTDNPGLPGGDAGGSNATGGSGPAQNSASGGSSGATTTENTSVSTGGTKASGGSSSNNSTGGAATGGKAATGGAGLGGAQTGGKAATGGAGLGGNATGGAAVGGAPTGGKASTGGAAAGGSPTGGKAATGGAAAGGSATGGAATGGKAATGGAAATGGSTSTTSCSTTQLSGGTQHCSSNQTGTQGSFGWSIWSSGSGGCITPYGTGAAFKATWNNSGDFLAREGCSWNETKTYDKYGDITADYSYTKSGSAGGYSYIGIYGWSNSPLIEFYIVDDWYGNGPPTGGGTQVGSFTQDGATYKIYKHQQVNQPSIHGTQTFWQYFSVRQTARQCGHIDVSAHFKEWASLSLNLGVLNEAKLVVEAGGGSGSIDFHSASMACN